uniref:Uncharacterized protein n=1 Tax=Quercus lobata TaxID=97700 RepID=A0A7N2R5Y0_QUELO
MSNNEMFLELFGPEHHSGYGYGVSPTELWGYSSFTILDLQRQLKEYKERRKENDANLLRKLKEFEKNHKESDANVQLLKAQVSQVENLLAQVLKKRP